MSQRKSTTPELNASHADSLYSSREEAAGMTELGKANVSLGVLLVLIGGGLMQAARLSLPLGRLPGEIADRGRSLCVFVPLGTSTLQSFVLSLAFCFLYRLHK